MQKKKDILLKAMKEMRKMLHFQDKVKEDLGMEIYELQTSQTAGVLFDSITDLLLNKEGNNLLGEFMFGGIPLGYNEDNPFDITVENKHTGKKHIHGIKTDEDMCYFLWRYGYFKKMVDASSYENVDYENIDKNSSASKLHGRLVQTCIDYINETGDTNVCRVEFNADSLQESAQCGSWQPCTDSYCGVEKWNEKEECYIKDSESV